MADNIDDLLDEVEEKFLNNYKVPKPPNSVTVVNGNAQPSGSQSEKCMASQTQRNKKKVNSNINDELSEAIQEICSIQSYENTQSPNDSKINSRRTNDNSKKKCIKAYLGDSSIPIGFVSSVTERCCGNLICLGCDFKVVYFNDFKWKPDTDYLFLRNNIPEFQRLRKQLFPAKGCRAYACQCKWTNCRNERRLPDADFKWICASH